MLMSTRDTAQKGWMFPRANPFAGAPQDLAAGSCRVAKARACVRALRTIMRLAAGFS